MKVRNPTRADGFTLPPLPETAVPDLTDAEVRERLFETLRKQDTGMLGLNGDRDQLPQPMTAFIEKGEETLYFFTRDDSDLAQAVSAGRTDGIYVFGEKNRNLFATLTGTLSVATDTARVDQFWNPVVGAWYPDGKDDPHLRVLTFNASNAQVWLSDGGLVKFAFEIAKANLTHTLPDAGQKADLKL